MGVVDVCEGLVQLPRVPEVLRVRVVRTGHRHEVFRHLSEVRSFRHRNLSFSESAFCERNVPVDECMQVHRFGISRRKEKTLSTAILWAARVRASPPEDSLSAVQTRRGWYTYFN